MWREGEKISLPYLKVWKPYFKLTGSIMHSSDYSGWNKRRILNTSLRQETRQPHSFCLWKLWIVPCVHNYGNLIDLIVSDQNVWGLAYVVSNVIRINNLSLVSWNDHRKRGVYGAFSLMNWILLRQFIHLWIKLPQTSLENECREPTCKMVFARQPERNRNLSSIFMSLEHSESKTSAILRKTGSTIFRDLYQLSW